MTQMEMKEESFESKLLERSLANTVFVQSSMSVFFSSPVTHVMVFLTLGGVFLNTMCRLPFSISHTHQFSLKLYCFLACIFLIHNAKKKSSYINISLWNTVQKYLLLKVRIFHAHNGSTMSKICQITSPRSSFFSSTLSTKL